MTTQQENENFSHRSNHITIDRPDSSQLVDLHIYVVPKIIWKNQQNLAENEAMEKSISAGFVHVPQNMTIRDLRDQIIRVCGQESEFPRNFTYLRSVGRCFTKVKKQQETDLRVKHYRPPTTFAPEIFLLEENDEEILPEKKIDLVREASIEPRPMKSSTGDEKRFNSTSSNSAISRSSSTLSARDLAKLREEQERLRLRQIELARQRRQIELEEENRQKNIFDEQRKKENDAATKIQSTYRGHRTRKLLKQEEQQKAAEAEIDRLQKEAENLTRRKAQENLVEQIEAREITKLSNLLEDLKEKRSELEQTRTAIVRQMQQIHEQIGAQRKKERDAWKEKYLFEKKKTLALEQRARSSSLDRTDSRSQLEQVKLDLKNSVKLRQQAENECLLLRREIQQLRSTINELGTEGFVPQQNHQHSMQKQPLPISLDITLQY